MTMNQITIQQDEDSELSSATITMHPMADRAENLRIVEAMLFAACATNPATDLRSW